MLYKTEGVGESTEKYAGNKEKTTDNTAGTVCASIHKGNMGFHCR